MRRGGGVSGTYNVTDRHSPTHQATRVPWHSFTEGRSGASAVAESLSVCATRLESSACFKGMESRSGRLKEEEGEEDAEWVAGAGSGGEGGPSC